MAGVILAVITLCVVLPLLLSVVVIGTANDLSRGLLIKFKSRRKFMRGAKKFSVGSVALLLLVALAVVPVAAQQKKPNIMFIMGDDIGWMQPSIYHRGLMVGETPNIDRIGQEGAIFMDYLTEQSCTSGRNAFFTGMYRVRPGMIPPQLPGSPSYLRPGTPALAKFLSNCASKLSTSAKNNLALPPNPLPR